MIDVSETIEQDQLLKSGAPGKVNVVYPRGSSTWLEVNTDAPVLMAATCPAGTDGVYQQFTVTASGHLHTISDRPTSVGAVVLGNGLQPLL